MPRLLLRCYCQGETALPDNNFASLDFICLGTQISGKAVFFSPQMHNADDSCEVKTTKWDFGNREHQRTSRETALCPNVFSGKGISPVTFNIADGIMEHIGSAVDEKNPIHRVPHTENAVPALHEGHVSERSHDVVLDRRELTKPDRTICTEFRCLDVQRDAFVSKSIPSDANLIALFLKIRVGEWHLERLRVGNQLYGAELGLFGSVNRRNNGKCLLIRLAAKIPATKIVAHRGTSRDHLGDIIPIFDNDLDEQRRKP